MKSRVAVGVCLFLVALAILLPGRMQKSIRAQNAPAGSGAPPLSNPLKVALLKWYKANTTTTVQVGVNPEGMAFDGADIWVANNASSTVNKIRTIDGVVLSTFSVVDPYGVCFDGANVWITSNHLSAGPNGAKAEIVQEASLGGDNAITKLRASDGKVLGVFNVGRSPGWPTFDGAYIWVPNGGDNTVTKLRAIDGKTIGSFAVGVAPAATAFDGAYIWVTNFTGLGNGTVTKLRSDGTVLGTFTVGEGPLGIAFDGFSMWVANANGGTITRLRASDGTVLGTFSDTSGPDGVVFDGANVWFSGGSLLELRASDGKQLFDVGVPGNTSTGITFDGANIWVSYSNMAEVGKL